MRDTPLPPYVWAKAGRRGQRMLYFRAAGRYHRLPDDPDSAEFHARYAELKRELEHGAPRANDASSIGGLIAAYKASPEYLRLSPNTRTYYATHLDRLHRLVAYPAASLSRAHVLAIRDKLADRPRSADQTVAVISRLYTWGIDRELVAANPALKVGKLDLDGGSYEPWTEAERARFEASAPPLELMTAYMIARYVSPRRGDILRLTAADYTSRADADGISAVLRIGLAKTRRKGVRELMVPCPHALMVHIECLQRDVGLLVPGPRGKPWEPSAFSRAFRTHLDAIGLEGRHLHGLRHTCATALAEAGCSDQEIESITGHTGAGTVRRYTAKARQAVLARAAMAKVEGKG